MENYRIVNEDIPLRSKSENGCDIYWTVYDRVDKEDDESDLANWIYNANGSNTVTINGQVKPCTRYNAHNFEVTYDEREKSNDTEAISNVEITIANNGVTENFNSPVTLSPAATQNISNIDHVYYGYSDKSLNDSSILLSDKTGYIITKIIDDGTDMNDSTHEYSYYNLFGSLYVDVNNEIDIDDIKTENNLKQFNLVLENANPEKYLNLFFTQEDADGNKLIRQYASIPLHYEGDDNDYTPEKAYNALLKYPCSVSVYASGITNNLTEGISVNNSIKDSVSYPYQPYNTGLTISLRGMDTVAYKIISDHYGSTGEPTSTSSSTINIAADDVIDNMFIIITKQ